MVRQADRLLRMPGIEPHWWTARFFMVVYQWVRSVPSYDDWDDTMILTDTLHAIRRARRGGTVMTYAAWLVSMFQVGG